MAKETMVEKLNKLKLLGPFPKMKVRLTLTEEALGMTSDDPKKLEKFIELTNTRLEKKKKELIPGERSKEEIDKLKLQIEEQRNATRGWTIFLKDKDGNPLFSDHQIKGLIKEGFLSLVETACKVFSKEVSGLSKWNSARQADVYVHPSPRWIKINIPEGAELGQCSRPLGTDVRGQKVQTLACSETVPVGSTIEFWLEIAKKELIKPILAVFEYGRLHGIAGWRSGGKGRYTFEVLEVQDFPDNF